MESPSMVTRGLEAWQGCLLPVNSHCKTPGCPLGSVSRMDVHGISSHRRLHDPADGCHNERYFWRIYGQLKSTVGHALVYWTESTGHQAGNEPTSNIISQGCRSGMQAGAAQDDLIGPKQAFPTQASRRTAQKCPQSFSISHPHGYKVRNFLSRSSLSEVDLNGDLATWHRGILVTVVATS
ncbi:hypothetical protein VTI74DRAFT_968 [Chaetomium olivicolor]